MKWLITGAGGQLGSILLRQLVQAGRTALGIASPRGPLPSTGTALRIDLTDHAALAELMERERPDVIVHSGAISAVAVAHADPAQAMLVNAGSTAQLSAASARAGARFVYVSTDMVFDGEAAPYDETATPEPLSDYGRSKRAGELAALANERALVVRLPLLYGIPGVPRSVTFVDQVRVLREGGTLQLFHDEVRTPLWLEDAARSVIAAAKSDLVGALHLGGPERLSRLEMGRLLAAALGIQQPNIRSVSRLDVTASEPRARDLSLDSSQFAKAFGAPAGRTMREALAAMELGG